MTFTTADSEKARQANALGRARQRTLRETNIVEVQTIVAELLAGLGRSPIGGETVAAEVIAATTVKARRLREQGRDDGEERRLLRQLLAFSPFGLVPAAPPAHFDTSPAGTFRVVAKGGDPVADEATAPDEVSNAGK